MKDIKANPQVIKLRTDLFQYPTAQLITGAIIHEKILAKSALDLNVNKDNMTGDLFRTYNAVISLSNGSSAIQFRTKSGLVPFEETIPRGKFFGFLSSVIKSVGGFRFSHRETNNDIFWYEETGITPLICYESLFGGLTAKFVRNGASVLAVILNEGWYDDLVGARQFLEISRVRAIENRRYVVRSSNRGISGVIDPYGFIVRKVASGGNSLIEEEICPIDHLTLFTRVGNIFGLFLMVSLFLLCKIMYARWRA